ncbi:MAG: ROK family protein [Anaerolineae bacterium]
MALAVGVDVGGTKIAAALLDEAGTVLQEAVVPTPVQAGVGAVLDQMTALIQQIADGHTLMGIGIGCPGPVDTASGLSIFSGNLGVGWRNIPVRDEIRQRLGWTVPVWIQNDVRANALGELTFGAARGYDQFVYLAVGTGLGGCAVLNGQVISGTAFTAMEVGHVTYQPNGRPCAAGVPGCVEMYASGVGMVASLREHLPFSLGTRLDEHATTRDILEAVRHDDPLGRRILHEAADALGTAMAWVGTILNPPLMVIGGGLGHAAWDVLVAPAVQVMVERTLPEIHTTLKVVPSQVRSTALGAGALVWHQVAG